VVVDQRAHDLHRGRLHLLTPDLPVAVLEARISDDLRAIEGFLAVDAAVQLSDPLARLPAPTDDLTLLRTWPGRPDPGAMRWEVLPDGRIHFVTQLPHRFDATGWTREGLFAAGGWYPQPSTDAEALPALRWTVEVTGPAGATLAVGGIAGEGVVRWTGIADQVALAAVRRGQVTDAGGWAVITQGRPRRALLRGLAPIADAVSTEIAGAGVVVEAPLRRRLTRSGPGLAYVSDRAFRLTPGLARVHRSAVARGVAEAAVPQPDSAHRALAAAGLAPALDEALAALPTAKLLRHMRWLPSIDALLANQRMPFYADILGEAQPSDPVADAMTDRYAPSVPATAAAAQLADRVGPTAALAGARVLARGGPVAEAEAAATLPPGWIAALRGPPVVQDYTIAVEAGAASAVTVHRVAPADAPDETVIVQIDGVRIARTGGAGPFTIQLPTPPTAVTVDPDRHVAQTSRLGDRWPARYLPTAAAFVEGINLSTGQIGATAFGTLRRSGDTHNLVTGTLSTSDVNLVSARIGYQRKEGPLLDAFNRPHRLTIGLGASYLDPQFSPTDGGRVAMDLGLGYSTDNRVSWTFPLSGRRLGLSAGGGAIPGSTERWVNAGASAAAVGALHPRVAVAGRAGGAMAQSTVDHRLLEVGGAGIMASIPELPACTSEVRSACQPLADLRATAAVELRWAVVRDASVPGLLVWGSELQLAPGIEAVAADVDGAAWAVGATLGLTAIYDLLGADPSLIGVTAGWALAGAGLPATPQPTPELLLRWTQAF
jgi:hypothetical protein